MRRHFYSVLTWCHCFLECGNGLGRGGVGWGKSPQYYSNKNDRHPFYLVCDANFDVTEGDGDKIIVSSIQVN